MNHGESGVVLLTPHMTRSFIAKQVSEAVSVDADRSKRERQANYGYTYKNTPRILDLLRHKL